MTNTSVYPIMKSFLASLHLKEQGKISFYDKNRKLSPSKNKNKILHPTFSPYHIIHQALISMYPAQNPTQKQPFL